MELNISMNINVVPLARQRITKTGHCFNPRQNTDFRKLIQAKLMDNLPSNFIMFSEPVAVVVEVYKTTQPTYKRFGDIDNLIKAVFDAFNGLIWVDDSQVVKVHAYKSYAEKNKLIVKIKSV